MSITVNGQSCVPPGFRFHPTEEELLNYYLMKKVSCEKIDLDVIRDVDLNKLEPWDIQEKCRIRSTPQNDWYFFSHKDKKYPSGTRTNRATAAGFWKATGRDKVIYTNCKRIGMRKTLVFYKGRAPHGQKSDWIMHEYRLDEHPDLSNSLSNGGSSIGETNTQDDGWVVCRVFKKKNLHKALDNSSASPNTFSSSITTTEATKSHLLLQSSSDGALDQILHYMGRSCKQEKEHHQQQQHILNNNINITNSTNNNNHHHHHHLGYFLNERFMKLPALESPTNNIPSSLSSQSEQGIQAVVNMDPVNFHVDSGLSDWAAVDRLVASHLNGQSDESSKHLENFDNIDPSFMFCPSSTRLLSAGSQDYNDNSNSCGGSSNGEGEGDLWSLTSSASVHINDI